MQWSVTINGSDQIITLPDQIPDNVPFEGMIGGRPVKLRWQKLTRSFYILTPGTNGLWRCINTRSLTSSRIPGESDLNIAGEFLAPGSHSALSFDTCVNLHIPGQNSRESVATKKPKVLRSQITGKVIKVLTTAGAQVGAGDTLIIIEAMKMENRVTAGTAGTIDTVKVREGDTVSAGSELIRFKQG